MAAACKADMLLTEFGELNALPGDVGAGLAGDDEDVGVEADGGG